MKLFMDELGDMGYDAEWRKEVLKSSMKGYMKVLRKVQEGATQRNRIGQTTRMGRRYKKLSAKTEWFREEK